MSFVTTPPIREAYGTNDEAQQNAERGGVSWFQHRTKQSTMSSKTSKLSEAAVTASKNEEKEELAALIYRESQIRKKEAAAAADRAKKRKRSTSSSTRQAAAGCKDTSSDEMITRRTSLKRKQIYVEISRSRRFLQN
jgi:hypothetical protein